MSQESSEVRLKKLRFLTEINDLHAQILHRILKSWAEKLSDFTKTRAIIEQKYDLHLARVSGIQSNVQSKLMQLKNQNKELSKKRDALLTEINKTKVKTEDRYDNTKDIEVEAMLKVQKEQLEQKLQSTTKELDKVQSRRDFYFSMYTEYQTKLSKIRQKEAESKLIAQMAEERKALLDELKRKVDIEQGKLSDDLILLEQYRNELLGRFNSPKKKGRRSQNIVNSWRKTEESEKSEDMPVNSINEYNDSFEEEEEEEDANPDAKALEQQILTLLSTGVYDETDPIIISMRNQLASLKN